MRGSPLIEEWWAPSRDPRPRASQRDRPTTTTMNTPDAQQRRDEDVAPDAPLANRIRQPDENNARHVRRRLSFGGDEANPAFETHWRLRAIQVRIHRGLPVYSERSLCIELYDRENPLNTTFNEAFDTARIARGSYVHRELSETGHVSRELNCLKDHQNEYESDDEYKRRIMEDFRAITYIKL